MEIPTPISDTPTVLVLGPDGPRRREIESLCRDAGLLADHAGNRSDALAMFLERGGHEVVICLGGPSGELSAVTRALRTIDPELTVIEMRDDHNIRW